MNRGRNRKSYPVRFKLTVNLFDLTQPSLTHYQSEKGRQGCPLVPGSKIDINFSRLHVCGSGFLKVNSSTIAAREVLISLDYHGRPVMLFDK